jgi:hypothetical protein
VGRSVWPQLLVHTVADVLELKIICLITLLALVVSRASVSVGLLAGAFLGLGCCSFTISSLLGTHGPLHLALQGGTASNGNALFL